MKIWEGGVSKMMVTGGNLVESRKAIDLSKQYSDLFATVGCHPTRCDEFDQFGESEYYSELLKLINENREHVVAIGEFGLDYDRTKFCSPEVQRKYFERQLDLSFSSQLPLFLHCRAAGADLVKILSDNVEKVRGGGVVHSFDGSAEERDKIL